ncbi:hypothetical protein PMIN05_006370 [Paraphaeosphaeria minitans]
MFILTPAGTETWWMGSRRGLQAGLDKSREKTCPSPRRRWAVGSGQIPETLGSVRQGTGAL